jgi:RNA polymerase sigma-70 factor (ECF subfamily)
LAGRAPPVDRVLARSRGLFHGFFMGDPCPGRGREADFSATHWTVVLQAGDEGSPRASDALEQLCHRYWYPLYVFVRRQGLAPEDAQDITQGFFHQLLSRGYLRSVDPERGRFRSFLLASIKHFLLNEQKRAGRLKRGGGRTILSLDHQDAEVRFRNELGRNESPEHALDRSWATTVMERAMAQLASCYRDEGHAAHFQQLRVFLGREARAGEYDTLAEELGMTKNALGVFVHRMRKRYGDMIRSEVAHTVSDPLEVDAEMRHLHTILSEK